MRFIVDCIYLLVAVLIGPKIIYRMLRQRRYRSGWAQRFGKITRKDTDKKCIWLHAVSVGEVNAAKTVVAELENKFGEFEIVISTTTDTGFGRASALYGEKHTIAYFPFDFSWTMRRAFCRIRPAICLLMEQELWPNFVQIAERLNVPVVVVNGRISDKGFNRYRKIKPLVRKMFQKINLILAQTEQYAERFIEIGAASERVIVTGSLKYDTAQITDKIEGADALAAQLGIENACCDSATTRREKLWVAGATGPGEEKILLEVYQNLKQQEQPGNLRLVIVPRKPERFDEVAQLIKEKGFGLVRYSRARESATEDREKSQIEAVILGDTMGDLRKFYSLATIIFVGRSLVPMGGSDMAEAAALGKCTVFGPHTFNFKQTVDALLADNGALMVNDKQDLLETMQKCFTEPDFAERIARNGREVIKKNQGATKKTIDQIAKFLAAGADNVYAS